MKNGFDDIDINPYCKVNPEFQTPLDSDDVTTVIPGIYKTDNSETPVGSPENTAWNNGQAYSADLDPELYLGEDFKKVW